MKTEEIIDAIGGIDEEMIRSALKTRKSVRRKKIWKRIIPAALVAIFAAFLVIMPKGVGRTTNPKYVVPINETQIYYTSHESVFRSRALCLYDSENGKTERLLKNSIAIQTPSGIVGFNTQDGSLYELSGTDSKKIGEVKSCAAGSIAEHYALIDNELYYLKDGKAICKENITTGQVVELVKRGERFEFISDLGFCGRKMFYTDAGVYDNEVRLNVYTADTETGKEEQVCWIKADDGSDFTGSYHITYFNDFLTVCFKDGIYIVDVDDLSCKRLSKTGTYSISLHDNKLYFISTVEEPSGQYYNYSDYLSCIDLATGEEMVIMPVDSGNAAWGLYVTDNGFFYVNIRDGLYYQDFDEEKPVHIDK